MKLFEKKAPLIVADMAAEAAPPGGTVSSSTYLTGNGGLNKMAEQTLALTIENNHILKEMRTWNRIGFWTKIVVWALVLGLPVIFFQPLLNYLRVTITENPSLIGLPSSSDFYKAVNDFSTKHPIPQ